MKIEAAVMSDIGLARKQNQDNFFLEGKRVVEPDSKRIAYYLPPSERSTFSAGVFDGMGGEKFGEVASKIASDSFEELVDSMSVQDGNPLIVNKFLNYCNHANANICKESAARNARMGTTASFLFIKDNQMHICNLGDSRIYIFKRDQLFQISVDHTELNMLIKAGVQSKGKKGRLVQYLGISPNEMVLEPHYSSDTIELNDIIMICSDGITDFIDDTRIEVSMKKRNVLEITSELVKEALDSGGKDNITLIVLRILK